MYIIIILHMFVNNKNKIELDIIIQLCVGFYNDFVKLDSMCYKKI